MQYEHLINLSSTFAIVASIRPVSALQQQIAAIGAAFGVPSANPEAVAAAVSIHAAMPAQIAAMAAELDGIKGARKREAAVAFVDRAIAEVRRGVKPERDAWIAMHMADPVITEKLINAIAPQEAGGFALQPSLSPGGEITALNAEQADVARMLGLPAETMLAALKAEQKTKETR